MNTSSKHNRTSARAVSLLRVVDCAAVVNVLAREDARARWAADGRVAKRVGEEEALVNQQLLRLLHRFQRIERIICTPLSPERHKTCLDHRAESARYSAERWHEDSSRTAKLAATAELASSRRLRAARSCEKARLTKFRITRAFRAGSTND